MSADPIPDNTAQPGIQSAFLNSNPIAAPASASATDPAGSLNKHNPSSAGVQLSATRVPAAGALSTASHINIADGGGVGVGGGIHGRTLLESADSDNDDAVELGDGEVDALYGSPGGQGHNDSDDTDDDSSGGGNDKQCPGGVGNGMAVDSVVRSGTASPPPRRASIGNTDRNSHGTTPSAGNSDEIDDDDNRAATEELVIDPKNLVKVSPNKKAENGNNHGLGHLSVRSMPQGEPVTVHTDRETIVDNGAGTMVRDEQSTPSLSAATPAALLPSGYSFPAGTGTSPTATDGGSAAVQTNVDSLAAADLSAPTGDISCEAAKRRRVSQSSTAASSSSSPSNIPDAASNKPSTAPPPEVPAVVARAEELLEPNPTNGEPVAEADANAALDIPMHSSIEPDGNRSPKRNRASAEGQDAAATAIAGANTDGGRSGGGSDAPSNPVDRGTTKRARISSATSRTSSARATHGRPGNIISPAAASADEVKRKAGKASVSKSGGASPADGAEVVAGDGDGDGHEGTSTDRRQSGHLRRTQKKSYVIRGSSDEEEEDENKAHSAGPSPGSNSTSTEDGVVKPPSAGSKAKANGRALPRQCSRSELCSKQPKHVGHCNKKGAASADAVRSSSSDAATGASADAHNSVGTDSGSSKRKLSARAGSKGSVGADPSSRTGKAHASKAEGRTPTSGGSGGGGGGRGSSRRGRGGGGAAAAVAAAEEEELTPKVKRAKKVKMGKGAKGIATVTPPNPRKGKGKGKGKGKEKRKESEKGSGAGTGTGKGKGKGKGKGNENGAEAEKDKGTGKGSTRRVQAAPPTATSASATKCVPPCATPAKQRRNPPGFKKPENTIVIIGAGIAGLSAMDTILNANEDINVVVLEARERNGGRIKTVFLNEGKSACNIGANFVHGCDVDKGNLVFNKYTESGIDGLVDAEYGVEAWLDLKGNMISPSRVEKMKDLYTAVDEEMLKRALAAKEEGQADRAIAAEFDDVLEYVAKEQNIKMSETDKGIMRFVQKNQHCYCAPASELSFFDLVDTFNAGSLEGGDKMALGGE